MSLQFAIKKAGTQTTTVGAPELMLVTVATDPTIMFFFRRKTWTLSHVGLCSVRLGLEGIVCRPRIASIWHRNEKLEAYFYEYFLKII